MISKKILGGLFISLMILANFYCKQQTEVKKESLSLLVTFVSGNVKVIQKTDAGNSEVNAKIGMKVNLGDKIRTENGKIDLQTKTGATIRVKEFTSISIEQLASSEGGETKLQMENGNILAKVQKSTSKEEFKVATPTTLAGVRGTFFTVEFDPFEKTSNVQVVEGKVSMQPRIQILEKYSQNEIEAKPELKKLAEIQNKEVVIEENKQGKLNPIIEKQVALLNEETSKEPEKIEIKLADIQKLEKAETVVVNQFTPSPEIILEKETMVTLTPQEIKQVEENKNVEEILLKKKEEVKVKENEILKKIEENASTKKFNNENEIKQHYNKLEVINLRDGTKITGAVIAQTEDVLVVHTPKGVVRINKDNVESQEFK